MGETRAEAYLERPYSRVLIWDRETATYTAKIAEFPGCVTEGKTAGEALKRLKSAARSWIEAVLDSGRAIPEPMADQEYSGRFVLRLSRSLHRRSAELAQADGISLNQFIATALAERVGTVEARAGTTMNMQVCITRLAEISPPQFLLSPSVGLYPDQTFLKAIPMDQTFLKAIPMLGSAGTAN
ncbi:MAG: type II toxin-antitoxin system HicB family antitoxin [Gammaproteobacteria bacterium]